MKRVRHSLRTLGGDSNAACNSRIRLFEPFTRKVPSTSVAGTNGVSLVKPDVCPC